MFLCFSFPFMKFPYLCVPPCAVFDTKAGSDESNSPAPLPGWCNSPMLYPVHSLYGHLSIYISVLPVGFIPSTFPSRLVFSTVRYLSLQPKYFVLLDPYFLKKFALLIMCVCAHISRASLFFLFNFLLFNVRASLPQSSTEGT